MQLDEHLQTKVRFHLGFNAGAQIPAGDRSRLEEAMNLIPDEYWYSQIVNHISRCDRAYENSEYFPQDPNGSPNFSRLEQIAGDVQRTISTSDPLKGDEYFWVDFKNPEKQFSWCDYDTLENLKEEEY